jgi:predicted dehydrogenase
MANKLQIGILGCGAVAYRWYFNGLKGSKTNYAIKAVCDIDLEKARIAATDYAVPYFCDSLDDLIKQDLDLIVVLTRHQDHYQHIKTCLSAGINVYSEKPFADNAANGLELLHMAKERNLMLGCAPQIMLSSRNKTVKQLLENNLLGKVTFVRASCSNLGPAGRADTDYDPAWFYNEGGSMASLGIYGLSALLWLLGKPKSVAAIESIAMPERIVMFGPAKGNKITVTAPDNVACLFDFGNGTLATFDGSYSVATPPKYDFEIHGEKGSLLVGGFGGPSSVIFKPLNGQPQELGPDDDCHLRWTLAWGVEETIAAIIERRSTATSAEFALDIIHVMEKIKESSAQRKIVPIDNHLS